MSGLRKLVLDVLIPFEVPKIEFTKRLSEAKGVEGVDVLIQEVERKVETAKISLEGTEIDFEEIKDILEKTGASLQSLDRIVAGKRIVS
jgi:hypothetical protein